jgi:pimeloyl-ACP methyl ester carboxylesterase
VNAVLRCSLLTVLLAHAGTPGEGGNGGSAPGDNRAELMVSRDRIETDAGYPVTAILSRPRGSGSTRLAAVMIVGWLSCDAIDGTLPGPDTFNHLIYDVARESGMLVFRVEKPGVDGSPGPPCSDNDFSRDLAAYQAGLRSLAKRPDVDPSRIYLLGMSNGGGVAPLVAGGLQVAGYVVSGGWAKTWLEHMLELERRRMALAGRTPGQVSEAMKGFADFYSLYLNGHLTPRQVEARRPDLKGLWYDEPTRQYGRPAKYFHQLQALNLAEVWQAVKVPVLAVHGEHDWIMSQADHEMIVDLVNRNRPGLARFVSVPRMDHFYRLHDTPQAAFRGEPGEYAEVAASTIVAWLRAQPQCQPADDAQR